MATLLLTLASCHLFMLVAIETTGVFGPHGQAFFLKELGRRLLSLTGEPNAHSYLIERLSIAVQRCNAAYLRPTGFEAITLFVFVPFLLICLFVFYFFRAHLFFFLLSVTFFFAFRSCYMYNFRSFIFHFSFLLYCPGIFLVCVSAHYHMIIMFAYYIIV